MLLLPRALLGLAALGLATHGFMLRRAPIMTA